MKALFTSRFKIIFFLVLLSSFGCKKDILKPALSTNNNKVKSINDITGSPIPPLDWENIAFMPGPPNSTQIPVPWQGGLGGAKIDDDIIFDYHNINGWELVYNTFNTSTRLDPLYFMLYNKYRGVLRTYFYISPGSNYPSSNIVHFLNVRGTGAANSPILNFAGQDIIDIAAHNQSVSQIQPYKVSTTGSWYAAEFELAYDQATSQTPYDQVRLDWLINPNSITNIVLNGTQTGTIDGTITSTSAGSNFFSSAVNGILGGGLKVVGDKLKNENALKFLSTTVKAAVVDAGTSAAGGIIKGFLSGILGGGPATSTQKVSLKINTNINITGTATTESQLFDNIFSLPGTQGVTATLPYYPNYPSAMGVFYITAKPVVNRTVQSTLVNDEHGVNYDVDQRYSINESSFQIVFNQAVTNAAQIVNIRKEIVMLNVNSQTFGLTHLGGTLEQIGDKNVYTGAVTGIERVVPRPNPLEGVGLAVRITFDVVPTNSSAPKCTIVKTFLATENDL